MNPDWRGVLVPVLLAVQILVVRGVAGNERPPIAPPIERFPGSFGQWTFLRADPIDPAIAKELGADRLVSQSYVESPTGAYASLLMAWFQTRLEGCREPHSPKVCLPVAVWTPRVTDRVSISTVAGSVAVNRYVVAQDTSHAVILYWYQTPRRAIAGEWPAKFWLTADALPDRRRDTALVRVITWSPGRDYGPATAVAEEFVRRLYPALLEYLPP